MSKRSSDWVTASDVGAAEYCPYQLYLKKKGVSVDSATTQRLITGTENHRAFNKSHNTSGLLVYFLVAFAAMLAIVWVYLR